MKTKYTIIIFCVAIMALSGFHGFDDPAFLKQLKAALARYNTRFPEEKVYVQFDKPFYKPGEDIWLNTFVLNSNTHRPSVISDVVYVELIDPKGNVASKLELLLREGTAHGDFALAASAPGGIYRVRAYTQWIKNFGSENIFEKSLTVQRVTTPRLLLKLEFKKEAYGPSDEVVAQLSIRDLKNEMVSGATVNYSIDIDGKRISEGSVASSANGKTDLKFTLPPHLNTADGLLQAKVDHRGIEESISRSIPIVLNKISLAFFPEGGHFVQGIQNRIAFKAVNEHGKGADISGQIVDENNNTVCSFESFHMGMGAFDLLAETGKKYFARIVRPLGNDELLPLPAALENGFRLTLHKYEGPSTQWKINSPETAPAYFVAQMHGEIVYAEGVNLRKGENVISVPTRSFGSGIAVFTLFNNSGTEQCERLLFVNDKKQLNIHITTDKPRYQPREKVDMKIVTTDENGQLVPAKISLAIVDDQLISFADDKQDNILSSLLLSSELKGEIQEPSFYFDPNEPDATQALDYLMMTQGWRRFSWSEIRERDRIITYFPEKVKNISGLLQRKGQGVEGEVSLLELGNNKRALTVNTTRDGHFTFRNIDPTVPLLLVTKKPGEITLQKERPLSVLLNDKDGTVWIPEPMDATTTVPAKPGPIRDTTNEREVLNFNMNEDVQALSEVVVTGYGVMEKRELSASVTRVYPSSIDHLNAPAFEASLQGRVAGIIVRPQSGTPAARYRLSVRGNNSLAGNNEPLYVVDGNPIGTSLNQNFANGSMIGIEDIESIEVINSPEATALFGNAAANGAILISTSSNIGYSYYHSARRTPKFSSLTLQPRKFSAVREFYTAPPSESKEDVRDDFRTTIYWNPEVVTDEKGMARVSFYNNDAVSAFRTIAEGLTANGLIGRTESVFSTGMPLSIDTRLPHYLGFEDVLRLPVSVKNETSENISATISLATTQEILVKERAVANVVVSAGTTKVVWYTVQPRGIEGEFPLTLKVRSEHFEDEIRHKIKVKPVGFPVTISFSGKDTERTFQFNITEAERGTVQAELNAFPDVLSDLFTGAESILRQPSGCFEQVSSSNYPNILALQFLETSGLVQPEIRKRAMTYIRDGYKKLTAYEIKGGGFEWFGHPPAHEGLTAYGLIQFHEMKKVYPDIDEKMMERTREWLLSRRNNKGGFKQNSGKYGFSAASAQINNAYLVYALAETGTKNITSEYNEALSEALKSKDEYRMALMANAAFSLDRMEDYDGLINSFRAKANLEDINAEHSIVRSYGASLEVETLSLWTIALLKNRTPDIELIQRCIQQILELRYNGRFGSTQATALSLKALTEYARIVRTARDDGQIIIRVNDNIVDKRGYAKDETGTLVMKDFRKGLTHHGGQDVSIAFEETNNPLPYTLNLQWYTKKPPSHPECKVTLSTLLGSSSVKVNETVRLVVTLKNKTNDGVPMTVAVIGLPAGLSAQAWQLKEKQEKGEFDFYEILDDKLVLYYRELGPEAKHAVNFDLKAEVAGAFKGSASSAYLYYTDEFKHWAEGNSINIY